MGLLVIHIFVNNVIAGIYFKIKKVRKIQEYRQIKLAMSHLLNVGVGKEEFRI